MSQKKLYPVKKSPLKKSPSSERQEVYHVTVDEILHPVPLTIRIVDATGRAFDVYGLAIEVPVIPGVEWKTRLDRRGGDRVYASDPVKAYHFIRKNGTRVV